MLSALTLDQKMWYGWSILLLCGDIVGIVASLRQTSLSLYTFDGSILLRTEALELIQYFLLLVFP